MAFKFFAVLALVSAASAGDFAVAHAYTDAYAQPHYAVPAAAPLASPVFAKAVGPAYVKGYAAPVVKQLEYEAPAKYNFAYGVNDPHTGDVKEQSESREGDNVHGSYSLIDADGFKRTVEYTADEHNGFNAVVHREPLSHAPTAKVVAPAQYTAAPAVAKVVGPAAYAAPVAHYASAPAQYPAYAHLGPHGAPVAHYATAPAATYAAPAGYAAPVAYHAPAAYASPVAKLAAPVAHYAASPLAYSAPNQFYHH